MTVDVVALRRHTGQRRALQRSVVLGDLAITTAAIVDGGLDLDLELEAIAGGIAVSGQVEARWIGECRRCLEPVAEAIEIGVSEIFEPAPADDSTWPLDNDHIDLAPMLREAALLSLPLAPLCSPECAGPEPHRFPTGAAEIDGAAADPDAARDPRWSALDALLPDE